MEFYVKIPPYLLAFQDLGVTKAIDAKGNDVTSSFQVGPGVEVQSTPEPSTLFGLGLTFGCVSTFPSHRNLLT
jgi:hypothetical protein